MSKRILPKEIFLHKAQIRAILSGMVALLVAGFAFNFVFQNVTGTRAGGETANVTVTSPKTMYAPGEVIEQTIRLDLRPSDSIDAMDLRMTYDQNKLTYDGVDVTDSSGEAFKVVVERNEIGYPPAHLYIIALKEPSSITQGTPTVNAVVRFTVDGDATGETTVRIDDESFVSGGEAGTTDASGFLFDDSSLERTYTFGTDAPSLPPDGCSVNDNCADNEVCDNNVCVSACSLVSFTTEYAPCKEIVENNHSCRREDRPDGSACAAFLQPVQGYQSGGEVPGVCQAGECVPDIPPGYCADDSDCNTTEVCIGGTCQNACGITDDGGLDSIECTNRTADNHACDVSPKPDGTSCIVAGTGGEGPEEAVPGICQQGSCVPDIPDGACQVDSDCSDSQKCTNGTCANACEGDPTTGLALNMIGCRSRQASNHTCQTVFEPDGIECSYVSDADGDGQNDAPIAGTCNAGFCVPQPTATPQPSNPPQSTATVGPTSPSDPTRTPQGDCGSVPGDANCDQVANSVDYTIWRNYYMRVDYPDKNRHDPDFTKDSTSCRDGKDQGSVYCLNDLEIWRNAVNGG